MLKTYYIKTVKKNKNNCPIKIYLNINLEFSSAYHQFFTILLPSVLNTNNNMHLFSTLSSDIYKIVGKTHINCLIKKHKGTFPVEQICFDMTCTPCTSTRRIRLVLLLTRKPIKWQVHKHTPAVLQCFTKRGWGKLPLFSGTGYHITVRNADSAQYSDQHCATGQQQWEAGSRALLSSPVLSLSGDKQWAHHNDCNAFAQLPPHTFWNSPTT